METVRVYVRFRAAEKGDLAPWTLTPTSVSLDTKPHDYSFDYVFASDATQSQVFDITSKPLIGSFMEGYNTTIFAYGQSGSGKTFTMLGPEEVTSVLVNDIEVVPEEVQELFGITPRAIFQIFNLVESHLRENVEYSIKCSYIEIYNEMVNDLLSETPNNNLRIREFPRLGMCVIGMTEKFVRGPEEVFESLANGTRNRITTATEQNSRSSRSHTLFVVVVEQKMLNGSQKISKLNLVDLAGSEKISKTGVTGKQLKEAQNINLSLTTLGRCINALASGKDSHIPFRESKLTMILRESLGGNAKTSLLCTASQKIYHVEESEGTLKFAERAKKITIKAKSNLRQSPEELATIIDQLKEEVNSLRKQLHDKDEAGIPAPSELSDEIYIKYAEIKAQYESLNDTSQLEIERLRAKVEQLSAQEPPVSYAERLQEHLDRIEEANSHIEILHTENETLRRRYEEDVTSSKSRSESLERDNVMLRMENQQFSTEIAMVRQDLTTLEIRNSQLQDQIRAAEHSAKLELAKSSELEHKISSASQDLVQLAKTKEELMQTISSMNTEIALLHSNLVESQNQLSLMKLQLDNSENKLHLQMTENAALHTSLNEANKNLSDTHAALLSTEARSQQMEESHQQVISRMGEHIKELETKLEASIPLRKGSEMPRPEEAVHTDTTAASSPSKKSMRAKSAVSKLINELVQLKTAYEETETSYKIQLAQSRQSYEEKVANLEKSLTDAQTLLKAEMAKNNELEKNLKLANIELESVQFHLKMTKTELATSKARLAEETKTRQNSGSEVTRLSEELQRMIGEKDEKCAALERDVVETKRLMLESQQTYKELLASQQEAFQRLSVESGTLNRALQAKEVEYRELELLERSMETQLSKALITIQKMDRKVKQSKAAPAKQTLQTSTPHSNRRASMFFSSFSAEKDEEARGTRGAFKIHDIKSLYSAEVEEEESAAALGELGSTEDVCPLVEDD